MPLPTTRCQRENVQADAYRVFETICRSIHHFYLVGPAPRMACHVDWVAFVALRPCHKTFRAGQVGVTRVGWLPPVFIAYGNTPEEIVDRIDMQLVQECGTFGADAAQKLYGLCKRLLASVWRGEREPFRGEESASRIWANSCSRRRRRVCFSPGRVSTPWIASTSWEERRQGF